MASIQDILGGDPNGILAAMNPWSKDVLVGQMQGGAQRNAMAGQALQGQMIAAQQQEVQRQAQQQQMGDQALTDYLGNPTSQGLTRVSAYAPQIFKQIKESHDLKNEDQQRQDLRDLSSLDGMMSAGDWEGAAAAQQRRLDADRKAGLDVSEDQHGLDLIQQKSPAALAFTRAKLYAVLGPEKYAAAVKDQGDSDRANAELPGKIALTKAQAAEANAKAAAGPNDEYVAVSGAFNPDGSPVVMNKRTGEVKGGGGAGGAVPGGLQNFVTTLQGSEQGSTPDAKNPRSSATGNGQFINSTWLRLAKANHPEWTQGLTDPQILELRKDAGKSRQMMGEYTQENAGALESAGIPVTGQSLAMAYKLGPGDASKVIHADVNTPLDKVLRADVMAANPQLKDSKGKALTVGAYAKGLGDKFGASEIETRAGDPNATGEDFLRTLTPARQKVIKAMADGDLPMPSGARMTGQQQQLVQQVMQYDPTASAITLPQRKATRIKFTSGPQGDAVNSANTVVGHVANLDHAIDQLQNTNLGWVNGPAQFLGRKMGNKETQKAVASFNTARTMVSNELTKVFRGSNGAEADIQNWMKQLDSANSPVELHSTVDSMIEGLKSRIDALKTQYAEGMAKDERPPGLSPHVEDMLAKIQQRAQTGSGASAVAPTPQAIAMLKSNPAMAPQFNQTFGAGASKQYLGH